MKTYSVFFAIKPINGESKWKCYASYMDDKVSENDGVVSITAIGKTPEKALEKVAKEVRKRNIIY